MDNIKISVRVTSDGVVHIGQVARFGIFLKSASRLVPDGWVGLKSFGYRCHFRAFQLELDTLDTQNIGNGPVVEELQPFEVGRIPEKSGGRYPDFNQNHGFVFKKPSNNQHSQATFGTPKNVFAHFLYFLSPA